MKTRCALRVTGTRCILAVGLAGMLVVSAADARMYQWIDPQTRSPQLSGTPPSWYRSADGGPRVRVFEGGNLVDDTAIALPRAQAEELREAAFDEYEQRQRQEALRQLERTALMERRRREEALRLAAEQAKLESDAERGEAKRPATSRVLEIPEDPQQLSEEAVQRLKALLTDFDRQGGAAGNSN